MLQRLGSWLDRLSYRWLAVLTILVGMAPWPAGSIPHLVQKLQMAFDGILTKPLDIFDLVFHASPLLLLIAKGLRDGLGGRTEEGPEESSRGGE
jgi:hypothetical protein